MPLFGKPTAQDDRRAVAYREWFARHHPLAIVSALLAIFSFTHFGLLLIDELSAIALGIIAIRHSRRTSTAATFAYVGIVVGFASLICAIVIYTRR